MKNIFNFLFLLLSILFLYASCKEDDNNTIASPKQDVVDEVRSYVGQNINVVLPKIKSKGYTYYFYPAGELNVDDTYDFTNALDTRGYMFLVKDSIIFDASFSYKDIDNIDSAMVYFEIWEKRLQDFSLNNGFYASIKTHDLSINQSYITREDFLFDINQYKDNLSELFESKNNGQIEGYVDYMYYPFGMIRAGISFTSKIEDNNPKRAINNKLSFRKKN